MVRSLELYYNICATLDSRIGFTRQQRNRPAGFVCSGLEQGRQGIFTQDSTLTDTLKSDSGLAFSTTYYWRVRAENAGGASAWSEVRSFTTIATGVLPNGPVVQLTFSVKSFSHQLRYTLPKTCQVLVRYFNLKGRQIASLVNMVQGPGHYTLKIDRTLLPSGVYCMVFEAGSFVKRELTAIVGR
jgi:hypothetical protein